MRVIGEIRHPVLKITIFQLNNRLSVQFEDGLFTQVYKFRSRPGLEHADDVRRLVDAAFLKDVLSEMERMRDHFVAASERLSPGQGEGGTEFEEII